VKNEMELKFWILFHTTQDKTRKTSDEDFPEAEESQEEPPEGEHPIQPQEE
jgi:hypothetical protein